MTQLQKQYLAFLNTPHLWKETDVLGINQFIPPKVGEAHFNKEVSEKLRLGNLVEQFTFFEFLQNDDIELLATNLQIAKDKVTKGEIDCLLRYRGDFIHLEIVYKFYLYDASIPGSELHKWVGPNKNDTLIKKLNKLKSKQLPLLYTDETIREVEILGFRVEDFLQMVYFKAQLFLPLALKGLKITEVNNECIKGHYIKAQELHNYAAYHFYIPSKRDWLNDATNEVQWINYESFMSEVEKLLGRKKSPLSWFKSPTGELDKVFVVWWE